MTKLLDSSPNFSIKSRKKEKIKFVIIHYTGMQSEIESVNRLKDPTSKVSCHYLINRKGVVIQMVRERNVAWHAGKSKWGNYRNLNNNSIGIELVNRGHSLGYQKFTSLQINSLIKLCKNIKKRYKIREENFLGHSDIAPLRKIDPGEKFPWKKLSFHGLGKWYQDDKKKIYFDKKKLNKLFFKNLRKIGFRYCDIYERKKSDIKIIKSFQSHFLPKNVTGKLDQKTYKISCLLSLKSKIS